MAVALPEPLRVVIDTSVALPVLTREAPQDHWLVGLWKSRRIIPLTNSETMRELAEKIREASPTAREFQAQRYVRKTLNHYSLWCETVPLTVVPGAPVCRDPDDQMFVELAIAGRADLLIARDDDFLVMRPLPHFKIMTDAELHACLQNTAQPER